jgi:hypothetical protein
MCAGNASRQAQHAQEKAKREFAAQAAQQQQTFEQEAQMLRTQMEQNKPVPPPVTINEQAARVTSRRSKRAAQRQGAMGAASLRIPTAGISTGGGAGTPSATAGSSVKLNIG